MEKQRWIGLGLAAIALAAAWERVGVVCAAPSPKQSTENLQTSRPFIVAQTKGVDLTHVLLGDGKLSNRPKSLAGQCQPEGIDRALHLRVLEIHPPIVQICP